MTALMSASTATDNASSNSPGSESSAQQGSDSSSAQAHGLEEINEMFSALTPVVNALGVGSLLFGKSKNDNSERFHELHSELSNQRSLIHSQDQKVRDVQWGVQHLSTIQNRDMAAVDTRFNDVIRCGADLVKRSGLELTDQFNHRLNDHGNTLRGEFRDGLQVLRQENLHSVELMQNNINTVIWSVTDLSARHNETAQLANANRALIVENAVGLRETKDAMQLLHREGIRREGLITREIDTCKEFSSRLYTGQQALTQNVLDNRTLLGANEGKIRVADSKIEQMGAQVDGLRTTIEQQTQRVATNEVNSNGQFKLIFGLLVGLIISGAILFFINQNAAMSNGQININQRPVELPGQKSTGSQEELLLALVKKLEDVERKPQESAPAGHFSMDNGTLVLVVAVASAFLILVFIAAKSANGGRESKQRKRKQN